jgi:hypothetical protein
MSEFGPGDIHAGMTPLEVALTQLAVRETAPNRGPQVDVYLHSVGIDPSAGSYPWCVAFVRWCCSRVGIWLPRTASVKRLWEMGEDLRVDSPQPGDVGIHLRADGLGHCGFFMRWVDENYIETVDGNTNSEGSREGDRVAMKIRPASYWNTGWLRPRLGKVGVA